MPCSWRNSARPSTRRSSATSIERDPAHLGGVVAGHRRGGVEHRHLEVEDHEVVLVVDALDPPDQLAAHAFEPGLLAQLAHDGLGQQLAALDPTPGHRPLPRRRAVAPAEQQDDRRARPSRRRTPRTVRLAGPPTRSTGRLTPPRPIRRRRQARLRRTTVHDDRSGGEPERLEEVLACRLPGRATASMPTQPCRRHQATSRSIMASPTPTPRASGSVKRSSTTPAGGRRTGPAGEATP